MQKEQTERSMIHKVLDTEKVKHLFGDWQETMIWSCLEKVMGDTYADDLENPQSVMAVLADFIFYAGKPNRELVLFKPAEYERDIIMVPQNIEWQELIADSYKERAKRVTRYAIKKEGNLFDRNRLQSIVDSLDPAYSIHIIDEDIFRYCKENDWGFYLVSQFSDYEMYQKLGLGVVVMKDGEPVSSASSYTRYKEGIEIEIDTRSDYRRNGLASVCGAKLIMECLDRNLYPSWDADNKWSVALAEKLGYHFDHEYTAYEIRKA